MKNFNLLRKSERKSVGTTLALTVGSPSAHRRYSALKHLTFMLLFLLGSLNVWGGEELVYTLDGTVTGGTAGYAEASKIEQNSVPWQVMGNTTMNPWRLGGKGLTNQNRSIYCTSAFSEDISKVTIETGSAGNSLTVNSVTLTVSTEENGGGTITDSETKTTNLTSSTLAFSRPAGHDWSGQYFTIVFNVTRTSNSGNGYIQFVNAKLYKESSDVIVKTLKSIAVGGMTTSYEVGDAFSFDGTCTATYSVTKNDVPQADEGETVTPTEVTSPDMSTSGNKTITVSYTEDAITKTTTYDITVSAALPKITIDGSATGITTTDEEQDVTAGGFSFGGRFKQYSTTALWFTSGTGFIYNKESFGKIRKITINYKSGGSGTSYQWIKLGDAVMDKYEEASTNGVKYETSTGGSSNTFVVTGDYEYFCLSVSNKNLQATSIVISYEADPTAPSVTIDPTEISLATPDAANGTIDATYENIDLANVTVGRYNDAECTDEFTGDWLTAMLNDDKDIEYTIAANTGAAARTAYIKLTAPASNGTSPAVVKIIEVSQAKAIPTYTSLDAVFAAATDINETVNITFDNWVISAVKGNNAYLTDGTYGLIIYTEGHGFEVGNVLSGTAQTLLKLYQGNAQLSGLMTTTTGLTVTTGGSVTERVLDTEAAAELTGANAGSLIKISGECTEPTTGRYYINGIQLYTTLYAYETPTVGDVYDCTGIFVMYNTYKEILPRQNGDLVPSVVTPTAVITFEDFNIEKGQNTTLAATVAPAVAASAEVTYSIVDGGEYVSLVGDDELTANEIGTAHIRATVADNLPNYYGATKDITVTVTAPDSRYKAEQTGFTEATGKLATVTEGTHKDKEYISYEGKKGTASTATSIQATDKIRIYQNGGLLVIGAAKGCKIDQVFLTTGGTYNTTTIGYSTSELSIATSGDAVAKETEWHTATGLNTDTVVIVCLGTDKYTRIDVAKLDVRYTGDPIEVSSIDVGGTYQTVFEKNETFNHDGVVVTATYTDDSHAVVTGLAEFSDPDMTTLGVKTVTVSYGGKSTTYDIEVVAATLTEIALSGTYPTRFHVGDAFSHTGMTVTASYSDYSEEDVTASAIFSGYDMFVAGAQTVTVEFGGQSAEYQIIVVPENTDVLTADLIGVEGTSYADWSDKTGFGTSSVYAGNSTNGSGANAGAIQLRYNASEEAKQAGIILTGSNGMVLKGFSVTVKSGSNTLNVYGKNTAYTSRLDLYSEDEATRGKLIGTVSATGALTLEEGVSYDDNYQYIGMRSNSGALYLSSIMITWGDASVTPPSKDLIRGELSNGKWGTICPKQNVEEVEGATFYQISYLEEQGGLPYNVVFDAISGTALTAGQPYFFIAEGTEIRGIKSGDAVTSGSSVNGFYGWISPTDASMELTTWNVDYDASANNTYVIYDNSVLRINQSGTMLKSERCYININSTEPSRSLISPMPGRNRIRMSVQNTNTATGMDAINASEKPMKMVIEGQLYILRGEKMYNAKGQLVK